MFKYVIVILAVVACAAAKPHLVGAPVALTAPAAVVAVPAPFVTATSSQVIARNYNGVATAPVVAPVAAPIVAKAVAPVAFAGPVVAKTVAPVAFSAPVARYAAAYSTPLAYSSPVVAKYAAAPFAYPAHFTYAAAASQVLW